MKVCNLLCKIVCAVSVTTSILITQAHATNNSDTCEVYPLTLPYSLVSSATSGDSYNQLAFGSQANTHGWLTWSGNTNDSTAAASLLPPGDDGSYINPNDSNDSIININDWVFGLSSIPTSNSVSTNLNSIIGTDIHIPLWSHTTTQSGKLIYQVQEFGVINISGFKLKGKSSLSFTYKGPSACSGASNTKPVANPQSVSTAQDTPIPITLSGSDADSDPLTYILTTNPTNGNLTGSGANYTYTPNNAFTDADSFTFKVNDGTVDSDIVTINISVTGASNTKPVANAQSVSTSQDTALAITLSGSDADSDPLTYILSSNPTNGNLTGSGANYTYTPNNAFTGADSFTFKVNDGTVDSDIVTINISVTGASNNKPVANAQSVNTTKDTPLAITLSGSDADSDPLTYILSSNPTNGNLTGSGTNYTYTPNNAFTGADSFTFKVNDGTEDSAIVTINIAVTASLNQVAVAHSSRLTVTFDTALAIVLGATDLDNDPLTYTIVKQPQNGSLSGSGNNIVFTPNSGFFGSNSFTFIANDGVADSAEATIELNVLDITNNPTIGPDLYRIVPTGKIIDISLGAYDPDNVSLYWGNNTETTNGRLGFGVWTSWYRSDVGYTGLDSFSYSVMDTDDTPWASKSKTPTIKLHVRPESVVSQCEISPLTVPYSTVSSSTIGDIFEGLPRGDGENKFNILSWNKNDDQNSLVKSLTPPGDQYQYVDPFDIQNSSLEQYEWVRGFGYDLASKNYPDVSHLIGQQVIVPLWSQVTEFQDRVANPSYLERGAYRAAAFAKIKIINLSFKGKGALSFEYQGLVDCNNQAPVIQTQAFVVNESQATLLENIGVDPDGDEFDYVVVSAPAKGTLTKDASGLVYTSNEGYSGQDIFTLFLSDYKELSEEVTITVSVLPKNNLNGYVGRLYYNHIASDELAGNVIQYSLVSAPAGMTIDERGVINWSPQDSDIGNVYIEVLLTDELGNQFTHSYSIYIEQSDLDGDGVIDKDDICPDTHISEIVDLSGCSTAQLENSTRNKTSTVPKTGANSIYENYDDAYVRSGTERHYIRDNVDQVVHDQINGLLWQDNADTRILKMTGEQAIAYCENLDLGGVTNWELPNLEQLFFLLDFNTSAQNQNIKKPTAFQNISDNPYWVSNAEIFDLADGTSRKLGKVVDFASGFVNESLGDTSFNIDENHVRCVSGTEKFESQMLPTAENINANNNGLMWTNVIISGNWHGAANYCSSYQVNGETGDWRLPNINELLIIFGETLDRFTDNGKSIWSSTLEQTPDGLRAHTLIYNNAQNLQKQRLEPLTSSYSTALICVREFTPLSEAVSDITAYFGEIITLDANSIFTGEGELVKYGWSHGYGYNDIASMSSLPIGVHYINLSVVSSFGLKGHASSKVTILANPYDKPPIADAGFDKTYQLASTNTSTSITLSAAGSSDDTGIISYEWSLNGEVLSNQVSLILDFLNTESGVYTYQLQVTDDNGNNSTDNVTITLIEFGISDSTPPTASIEQNLAFRYGEPIVLNVLESFDNVGVKSYHWNIGGHWTYGETATIEGVSTGSYVGTLKVSDFAGNQTVLEFSVNVLPAIELEQCTISATSSSSFEDNFPKQNIEWSGSNYLDVVEIEKSFNAARIVDKSVNKYLKMPTQPEWDSWDIQQKGLFLLNSEREARGIKPFDGVSPEVVSVALQFASYLITNQETPSHFRSSDNATPIDRLNENITIANNHDNYSEVESLNVFKEKYSYKTGPDGESVAVIPDENEMITKSIFEWLYQNKTPHGAPWSDRSHIFDDRQVENSGSGNSEGLVGFGMFIDWYKPPSNLYNTQAAMTVLNTIDPASTWDFSNVVSINTANAHLCLPKVYIDLDEADAPLAGLVSISFSQPSIQIALNASQQISAFGHYSDGSTRDFSQYLSFVPDSFSNISINGGKLTALNVGTAQVVIKVGTVESEVLLVDIFISEVPVADAGQAEITVYENSEFTLDASDSFDDTGIVRYEWYLIDTLLSTEIIHKDMLPVGSYQITLKVFDGEGNSSSTQVTVNVLDDLPPVAIAGNDIKMRQGETVTLDASNSSDDIAIYSYQWSLGGSTLSTDTLFNLSSVPEGRHAIELMVTDSSSQISTDQIVVEVLPKLTMEQCSISSVIDDYGYSDIYPSQDINWVGQNFTSVEEIEKAFNHARFIDYSIFKYLQMPSQIIWDSWTIQQQGMFLINSEREARGIKAFEGVSPEVVDVSSQFAEYLRVNNESLTHYRSSDNATPLDRLNENAIIAANHDFNARPESLFSITDELFSWDETSTASETEFIVQAIYSWIYEDKLSSSWSNRTQVLQVGLNENSGSSTYQEGLVGFGITMGPYDPLGYYPGLEGVVVAFNVIDPSSTWNFSNTVVVDSSNSNLCNSEIKATIEDPTAPVNNLTSILLSPSSILLSLHDSQTFQVMGHYSDGSSQDLSQYIHFVPDQHSVIRLDSGVITGLRVGDASLSVNVNGIESNTIDISVILHSAPIAIAGEDQTVRFGVPVTLDAAASTDDIDITAYQWHLNGQLVSTESSFTKTDLPLGTAVFELTVTDGSGLFATDNITITVTDTALPVAIAGNDQTIRAASTLVLDATASSDPLGIASYEWRLNGEVLGTGSTFSYNQLTEGIWTIELVITTVDGLTATDSIVITAQPELTMQTCKIASVIEDLNFEDSFPKDNISWVGVNSTDVTEIEKAFNHARVIDSSVSSYLKMPSQTVWDAWSVQQQGLFIFNSERQARGLKPFTGVSSEIVDVTTQYADYLRVNNEVITHYRSSDGASQTDRLNENTTIANNTDSIRLEESIYSYNATVPSQSAAVVNAIYAWIYQDNNPLFGLPWGHREHQLQTGLYENSGDNTHEGLLGLGVSMGDYNPDNTDPSAQGVIVVLNTVDPSATWDYNSVITVDTSTANNCNSELTVTIDAQTAPVANLQSLLISPDNINLNPFASQVLKVTGEYNDGSYQDLSSYVNFLADDRSIVSIDSGVAYAINTGTVNISASVNGITSNTISITVADETDVSNLTGTYAEQYLHYLPNNASISQYDPKAFSLFNGKVTDLNGITLSDVIVSFHSLPGENQGKFGSVTTNADGLFTLAGQAGKRTLVYSKDGYLTIHRSTISASNSWTTLADVTLLPVDSKKTFIDLASSTPQVHRSTIITDGFGERATTLVFNNINSVTVTDKVGNARQLTDFFVQATEYQSPNSMPADLPEETAFTYCSELQISGVGDEETVMFDNNVVMYVDNFLGFSVGEIVPIGYYDRVIEAWQSSENGVVVKLLDGNSDGKVDGLDYTGDNIADDINNNGSTTDEVAGIESFTPGETYWRGGFNHFTPIDYNWPAINDGSKPKNPNAKSDKEKEDKGKAECVSSHIYPKTLELHEDIAITGTGLTLHYSSQRTHGYHHKISANVSGADIPFGVLDMIAVLEIGGNRFEQTFAPTTYQDVEFLWDGTDPTGALVRGEVSGRLSIGYKYQNEYQSAGNVVTSGQALTSFPTAWAQWGTSPTGVIAREDGIQWSRATVTVLSAPDSAIANGWSISNHHTSTPFNMVYLGNGEAVEVNNATNILKTGLTESQYPGDDGYYQKGGLDIDYSVNKNGVLTDKVTGLQWQYFTNNAPMYFYKSEAIAYCENLSLGEANQQWRLPTVKEVTYSIDKSGSPQDFSVYSIDATEHWHQNSLATNEFLQSVVCVSADKLEQNSLDLTYVIGLQRNTADEVMIDDGNGLMWQDSTANTSLKYTWSESIDYCEALDHASYDDWRLPNINELTYILPNNQFVNETAFVTLPWSPLNDGNQPYWSSTSNAARPDVQAWAMESTGYNYYGFNKDSLFNVRCVRDDLTRSRSPYVFDDKGRHIKTLDMGSGITLTTFEYNAAGKLSTIIDRFGNTITINRDVNGKATEIVSPGGYITKLTVDSFNDLIRAEYDDSSAYDFVYQNSLMVEETDVRNNVFTRSFDSTGRIYQSIDPEGGQWDFFNNKDEFTKITRYGFTTAEGNMYESLISFLANGDEETVTTFKDLSQLTNTQQADDLKATYQSSGVVTVIDKVVDVKTKLPVPHTITTTLPSMLTNVVQLERSYAEGGTDTSKSTLTVTTNPGVSEKVSTVYSDTITNSQVITSAQGRTIVSLSDPITQQLAAVTITGLHPSMYQYDSRGRLSTITSGDRITTYDYDDGLSNGNLTSVTDAMNLTTAFDYDLMGRLITTTYHDGSVLEQSYDNNGNLASITPPGQPTHVFNYNSVDKEIDYTPPVVEGVEGVANPTTVYDYDRDRKLTTITRPDSQVLSFNYKPNTDQLASMVIPRGSFDYSYDGFANVTKIIAPDNGELSFTYDGNLPLSQSWIGTVEGIVNQTYNTDFIVNQQCINVSHCIDYYYDLDNLLFRTGELTISREAQQAGLINGTTLDNISMVRTSSSFAEFDSEITKHNATNLLSASYLRDNLGRITERTLDVQGISNTEVYGYNDAGRLASVTKGIVTTSYDYDDNGNRLSKSVNDGTNTTVTNGVYDAQDRLTSYGSCTYQYTENGELTKKVCGTETTLYSYDVLGNLLQVTLPNGDKIDYLIDGLDRRIGKKINGTLVQGLLYGDQLNPVAELDGSNNIVSQFVYGTKVNVPDYMIKGGVTYKIITDQLGSPRLVVNADTGVVAQQMDYDEFGIVTQDTNPGFQPFGFAGGLYEQATGLTRFGARDYDAHTGRWTSKDPIRFAGGDSNIYGYVFSDPVNFIDLLGLKAVRPNPVTPGRDPLRPPGWTIQDHITDMYNTRDAYARAGKHLTEFQKDQLKLILKTLKRCTCSSAIPIKIGEYSFIPDGTNQCTSYDNQGDGINDSTGWPLKGCSCSL